MRARKLAETLVQGLTGGAMALEELLSPSEAEASPISKYFFKAAARPALAKAAKSSAAQVLVGKKLFDKVIKDVVKGRGNWRYIILEDETVYPATKEAVQSLVRSLGTKEKLEAFREEEMASKITQAYKSLQYHVSRAQPFTRRQDLRDYYKRYYKELASAGETPPPMALVEAKKYTRYPFSMPLDYAELLADIGELRIIEILGR